MENGSELGVGIIIREMCPVCTGTGLQFILNPVDGKCPNCTGGYKNRPATVEETEIEFYARNSYPDWDKHEWNGNHCRDYSSKNIFVEGATWILKKRNKQIESLQSEIDHLKARQWSVVNEMIALRAENKELEEKLNDQNIMR